MVTDTPGNATISVVVCAYTDARRALLDNSIESILAQLGASDQLVVDARRRT